MWGGEDRERMVHTAEHNGGLRQWRYGGSRGKKKAQVCQIMETIKAQGRGHSGRSGRSGRFRRFRLFPAWASLILDFAEPCAAPSCHHEHL